MTRSGSDFAVAHGRARSIVAGMRRSRARPLMLCVAALAAAAGERDAAAAGGSFAVCYDRLKQLVALYAAQGGIPETVVDDPAERAYTVRLRYGAKTHEMTCTAQGELVVDGVIER